MKQKIKLKIFGCCLIVLIPLISNAQPNEYTFIDPEFWDTPASDQNWEKFWFDEFNIDNDFSKWYIRDNIDNGASF